DAPPASLDRPVKIQYDEDFSEGEPDTFLGLNEADIRLIAPTGGGGGLLVLANAELQLTTVQYDLVRVLLEQMVTDAGKDERVRGFVRSSELLATLSWDTPRPDENHLKQLVRRLRRLFARVGMESVLESRHGFGYRLRVRPRAM